VDVRVIAATNRDLRMLIEEKKFREDLYYRLNVMSIEIPPLRERREDILLLCEHFVKQNSFEMRKSISGMTQEAMDLLINYPYPGNVRQLANIMEYACIVCKGDTIDTGDLPREVREEYRSLHENSGGQDVETYLASHSLKEIEKLAIAQTLKKNGGRRDKTADDLGISKRGLLNKIHEYDLKS
jgi:transcriptional regulator with PAS, ATPase and Fis domain